MILEVQMIRFGFLRDEDDFIEEFYKPLWEIKSDY